jgi:hypothetical protein
VLSRYLPDITVLTHYAHHPEVTADQHPYTPGSAPADELEEPDWEPRGDPADYLVDEGEDEPFAWPNDQFQPEEPQSPSEGVPLAEPGAQETEPYEKPRQPVPATAQPLQTEAPVEQKPQLVVAIHPCGEKDRDFRHIQQLHGLLVSHPGQYHFAFAVSEEGRSYMIDFPNDTTDINDEVLQRLSHYVGQDNVIIRRE